MERRSIVVEGVVQGVGFRPFVFGLASRLKLHGFVKNRTGDVLIEVEGETESLDHFLLELTSQLPPLAHIDRLSWDSQSARGDCDFRIEMSETDPGGPIFVSADVATCDLCLAELFNPLDRRYRYPFLNCTNCGPRLTIVTGAPYDRQRTTMASFRMCDRCRAEYEDRAIVVFMPSQLPVRPAGRSFNCWTLKESGFSPMIRLRLLPPVFAAD